MKKIKTMIGMIALSIFIMNSSHSMETIENNSLQNSLQNSVEFSSLLKHLACTEEKDLNFADYLINKQGQGRRSASDPQHGMVFPINPEVLDYILPRCKGKKVLEIACADGINGILMALADAEEVYLNDIDQKEMGYCEGYKKSLSEKFQEKIKIIEGDCFNVLNDNQKLKGKIDIILCRNLIHFFSSKNKEVFLKICKELLSEEGELILTMNGKDDNPIFEKNPYFTSVNAINVLVYDYEKHENTPIDNLYQNIFLDKNEDTNGGNIFNTFTKHTIYDRLLGKAWSWDNDLWKKIKGSFDSETQKGIIESIGKNKEKLLKIKDGRVNILLSKGQKFSQDDLKGLCEKNGFLSLELFNLNQLGHITNEKSNIVFVGGIFKSTKK